MAKTFGNLKSNKLDMLDKLTMGKFAGCRICDIIADDFEYLIWLNKQGFVNFTTPVMTDLLARAGFKEAEEHYKNEVEPWESEDVPL
jgi:uncharacterized protein (DUF3820 family)